MNSIFAIALISIRNAIRSKIVIVLLLFLLITLIGLPLTLKGDGTLTGHVRILLRYTLGLATLILSIATVWASCAALSTEIRDRHIQLIVSKPVRATQIWLGKWLGLMTINVFFLALCFLSTFVALRWTTQPAKWPAEEIEQFQTQVMAAQRKVAPRPARVEEEVHRQYRAGRARGEWPAEVRTADILPRIERMVRAQANAVPPNAFVRWVFDVPHLPPEDRPLVLRYRFSLSVLDIEPIHGAWTIGAPGMVHRQVTDITLPPRTWHHVTVPAELVTDDGTLTVEFANIHERPVTVLFHPDDGLQLMVYAGGFIMNYVRAALLILFHLCFLAAVGITAGAYFSIPVAALASFYTLLLVHAGRFVGRIAQSEVGLAHGPDAGWLERSVDAVTHMVHRGLHLIIRPLESVNPLDLVAIGEWIAWTEVAYVFVVKVVIYSGILLALGAWHIAHKEVALPS